MKAGIAGGAKVTPEYRYEKLSWESHMEEQMNIVGI